MLHRAIVIQIEGASYRLREHLDLIPDNAAKVLAKPVTRKMWGRPKKTGA